MPRGKPNNEQASDPKSNKMEAVRRALEALGYEIKPAEVQSYVMENFAQDMNSNTISSYMSTLRAKAGLKGRRKKRGRPKKTTTATPVVRVAAISHDAVPWKDLRIIKDIAGRVGKKGLRELVELLD